jgi:hypothetical protein
VSIQPMSRPCRVPVPNKRDHVGEWNRANRTQIDLRFPYDDERPGGLFDAFTFSNCVHVNSRRGS